MAGLLSAAQALDAWDSGESLDDIGKALVLLAAAGPEADQQALARLPIGIRDARLLELRAALFGERATATTTCKHCGEILEFEFAVSELVGETEARVSEVVVDVADKQVRCRLPDSLALRAAQKAADRDDGRRAVLQACLIDIEPNGTVDDLTEADLVEVSRRLSEADPGADLVLTVEHASCGVAFDVPLSVELFLWAELDGWAQRTLDEVHELAARYGWSEADILSISPQRRRRYLAGRRR